ncbi:iron dicitrate transporter [Helicobacter pylori]|uniref:iron dicitrate transporter n=1 Tax=Helicobacter pylori TaxID=210 RepID=UPI001F2274C1|nr:iron dicitrate transporter [Helicobacter pylori]
MLGKHMGISAQANWINGQDFKQNSPTKAQNDLLDAVYKLIQATLLRFNLYGCSGLSSWV